MQRGGLFGLGGEELTTMTHAFRTCVTMAALGLLGLLVARPLLAKERVTIYLTDALGTPVVEMNGQGEVINRSQYRPYGKQTQGSGEAGPGFTGHVSDPDTGLVYMQARYYDPVSGRFLSTDPMTPSAGGLYGFSRYTYANDNPIANIDPDGRLSSQTSPPRDCGEEPCVDPRPPPEPTRPTTLPTVRVMASAVAVGAPIDWGGIGLGAISIGSIPTSVLVTGGVGALLYPTKIGAAPCEMPAGPPCGIMMSGSYEPGYWPADAGASEWGRRHGVGAREGSGRFHGIKQKDKGRPRDKYGVNPDTGDVMNPDGEIVGNLNDVKSK